MQGSEAVNAENEGNINNHTVWGEKKAVIEKRVIKDEADVFNALLSSIKSTIKSKQILE